MTASRRRIVLDRDGVINMDSDDYIKSVSEWIPLPGSLAAIAALSQAGYTVMVASNQSGIGRGLLDRETLDAIHAHMRAEVESAGGRLAGIYVCPHTPEANCDCRKPRPGLLRQIEQAWGETLDCVPVVGDKLSDLEAARAVGARPILVHTGKGKLTAARPEARGVESYADLAGVAAALLAETR